MQYPFSETSLGHWMEVRRIYVYEIALEPLNMPHIPEVMLTLSRSGEQ